MSNILRWSVWRHRWESAIFFYDFPPLAAVYEGKMVFSTLVRSAMRVHFQSLIARRGWGGGGNSATRATAGRREDEECCLSSAISPVCRVARHLNCRYYPISFVVVVGAIGSHGPITCHSTSRWSAMRIKKKGEINKFQSLLLLLFSLFVCVCVCEWITLWNKRNVNHSTISTVSISRAKGTRKAGRESDNERNGTRI